MTVDCGESSDDGGGGGGQSYFRRWNVEGRLTMVVVVVRVIVDGGMWRVE